MRRSVLSRLTGWGTLNRVGMSVVIGGAVLAASSAAPAMIIDDFSEVHSSLNGPYTVVDSSDSHQLNQLDLTSAVFDERQILLQGQSAARPIFDRTMMGAFGSPDSGVLFASTSGSDARLTLSWLDHDGSATVDLSGEQGVMVDLVDFDLPNGNAMPVTLALYSSGGLSTATVMASVVGSQSLVFDFANLQASLVNSSASALENPFSAGGVLADLTAVNKIQLLFEAPTAADFEIDAVATFIPEPISATTLGLMGLGMMLRRRREA